MSTRRARPPAGGGSARCGTSLLFLRLRADRGRLCSCTRLARPSKTASDGQGSSLAISHAVANPGVDSRTWMPSASGFGLTSTPLQVRTLPKFVRWARSVICIAGGNRVAPLTTGREAATPHLRTRVTRTARPSDLSSFSGENPLSGPSGRAFPHRAGHRAIEDQAQRQGARRLAVDAVEEVQEPARSVPRHAGADHLPIEQIERREERRGAMAVVVVRLPGWGCPGAAGARAPSGRGPESGSSHRPRAPGRSGGSRYSPTTSRSFSTNRLPPNPVNGRAAEPLRLRHRSHAPLGGGGGVVWSVASTTA